MDQQDQSVPLSPNESISHLPLIEDALEDEPVPVTLAIRIRPISVVPNKNPSNYSTERCVFTDAGQSSPTDGHANQRRANGIYYRPPNTNSAKVYLPCK